MKLRISMSMILLLIIAASAPLLLAADNWRSQDRLLAHFDSNVKFADKLLPEGDYLVVHDDDLKAAGEPCLYVYKENETGEPLVAIHCVRKAQKESERDQIAWRKMTPGTRTVEFVQFAGDAYAHYLH